VVNLLKIKQLHILYTASYAALFFYHTTIPHGLIGFPMRRSPDPERGSSTNVEIKLQVNKILHLDSYSQLTILNIGKLEILTTK